MEVRQRKRLPFQLGEWVVYPDLGVIRKGDDERRLLPKALQVLLVLLDAGARAVTRQDILDTVWGATYPSDQVVGRAVADLRNAFGEKAGEMRYIRTVPKFGYQLIVPAVPVSTSARSPWLSRPFHPYGYIAILAMGIVAIMLAYVREEAQPVGTDVLLRPLPLTADPGLEQQPRISPDGRWLLFAELASDRSDWDVHRLDLDTLRKTTVSDQPGITEHGPAWFPDGQHLALVQLDASECRVVRMSINGTEGEPIANCTTRFPTTVDVSPDGQLIAFTGAQKSAEGLRQIYVVGVDRNRVSRPVSTGVSETGTDFYPRFSPDGRTIAFLRGEPHPDHRTTLWIVDLESGQERRLIHQAQALGGMTWEDRSTLLVSVNPGAQRSLLRVHTDSRPSAAVPIIDTIHPDFRVDSALLVGAIPRQNTNLAVVTPQGVVSPLAISTRRESQGRFSPDGQWIAFVSDRTGFPELWVTGRDGQQARQLTQLAGPMVDQPSWYPDGSRITAVFRTAEGESLLHVRVVDGAVEQIQLDYEGLGWPAWLDANRLVFSCAKATFRGLCVLENNDVTQRLPGLVRLQFDHAGTITAVDAEGRLHHLQNADLNASSLPIILPADGRFGWSTADGDLVYLDPGKFLDGANSGAIVVYNLETGNRRAIASGLSIIPDTMMDIAPESGDVLLTVANGVSDDLARYTMPGNRSR